MAPRPVLKTNVMARIQEESAAADGPVVTEQEQAPIPMYAGHEREGSPYKWMFAASVVLFLISGILSFYFYNKWQQTEDRLQLALASEQQYAQNLQTVNLQIQQQEQVLSILQDPDTRYVQLQGVEGHPEAAMQVFWHPQQQKVYVGALNLPAPPQGKQYQLWALDNGQPVDAGMIALDDTNFRLQQMKEIGTAQAFAVTLEPEGGSENPTLEQLIVMGEVQS
nr:anti-sigma factor [Pontibacter harenae]